MEQIFKNGTMAQIDDFFMRPTYMRPVRANALSHPGKQLREPKKMVAEAQTSGTFRQQQKEHK